MWVFVVHILHVYPRFNKIIANNVFVVHILDVYPIWFTVLTSYCTHRCKV
jgi:hypothetical protein